MWAHVHVLEMRERAGAQRRQVPAVPGADRGGGPGIRGAVNYYYYYNSNVDREVFGAGRRKENKTPPCFFTLPFVFLSFLPLPM